MADFFTTFGKLRTYRLWRSWAAVMSGLICRFPQAIFSDMRFPGGLPQGRKLDI